MSTSAINAISATTLEQALAAIENAATAPAATTTATTGNTAGNSTAKSSSAAPSDSSRISPLGQLINTLQQLQKTDPAKYSQVTQQIATNLTAAAKTAQTQGNSSEAKQLTALAADFSSASQSGQVSPLVQSLTQTAGSGHHRHGSGADSTATSASSGNQLLSLLQTNETQSTQSTNLTAASTILNTLKASGIATA